ncbi:MAG: hypothetical protein K1X94_06690 [Sandaracinaceae bacterium]|nr:hypothetical protein [Sandaracinaceae bacterium]
MPRAVLVCLATLALGCGGASTSSSANANAPGAHVAPSLASGGEAFASCRSDQLVAGGQCISMEGSSWELTTHMPEGTRVFLVDFFPQGRCTSHDPADTTDDDEWAIEHKALRFWFNQRYVVYEAELDGPTTMHGITHNVTGLSWSWSAVRVR